MFLKLIFTANNKDEPKQLSINLILDLLRFIWEQKSEIKLLSEIEQELQSLIKKTWANILGQKFGTYGRTDRQTEG